MPPVPAVLQTVLRRSPAGDGVDPVARAEKANGSKNFARIQLGYKSDTTRIQSGVMMSYAKETIAEEPAPRCFEDDGFERDRPEYPESFAAGYLDDPGYEATPGTGKENS